MKYWMIFALLMGQSSWAIAAEQMGDRPFSAHEKAALFHKDSMPVLLEREFSTQDGALVPSAVMPAHLCVVPV